MTRIGWTAIALSQLLAVSPGCGGGGDGSGADAGAGEDGGRSDSGVPSTVDPSNQFAENSQEWAVPDNGLDEGFVQPFIFGSYRYWITMDIDGDQQLDIVQTGSSDQVQSAWDAAGSPYWKVFRGGGERWSASAVEWRVPASGGSSGFFAANTSGSGEWRTFDISGDGLPDLIQTSDPDTGYVWDQAGDPFWKVFVNDGEGGFARPAQSWPVPDSGTTYGFNATAYSSSYYHWVTLDMDGDRLPDLVQTADPATGRIWDDLGSPHWKVFANTGEGFSGQATIWSVPDSGTTGGFYAALATGPGMWRVMDLDDDGNADLVQTSDPATGYVWDASGEPYWKVFAGSDDGFAGSPHKWSVPRSGLDDGFFTAFADASYRLWSVIDIDGDRDLDLVQTGDVSHPARVWDASGDPYWKVYRNTGDGFSPDLHRWPVPTSGTDYGFYQVDNVDAETTWALLDADADGHLDLVQTEDPATGRVWDATGSPYWKVFRGEE
jgi:hypothetical protein